MQSKLIPVAALILFFSSAVSAQHLFMTADTSGFGSPSLFFGISTTRIDKELGEDYTLVTARVEIGIGR
jgi:hypothetical protein